MCGFLSWTLTSLQPLQQVSRRDTCGHVHCSLHACQATQHRPVCVSMMAAIEACLSLHQCSLCMAWLQVPLQHAWCEMSAALWSCGPSLALTVPTAHHVHEPQICSETTACRLLPRCSAVPARSRQSCHGPCARFRRRGGCPPAPRAALCGLRCPPVSGSPACSPASAGHACARCRCVAPLS